MAMWIICVEQVQVCNLNHVLLAVIHHSKKPCNNAFSFYICFTKLKIYCLSLNIHKRLIKCSVLPAVSELARSSVTCWEAARSAVHTGTRHFSWSNTKLDFEELERNEPELYSITFVSYQTKNLVLPVGVGLVAPVW